MPTADRESLHAHVDARGMLSVHVTPNARRQRIAFEDGVKIWVTVPPEDGKANKAVIALLAKILGVPKSALSLERGVTSRKKVIHIRA